MPEVPPHTESLFEHCHRIGAIDNELQYRGKPMIPELWSAAALVSHPHLIGEVDVGCICFGAQIQFAAIRNTAPHFINPSSLDITSRGGGNRDAYRFARKGGNFRDAFPHQEP